MTTIDQISDSALINNYISQRDAVVAEEAAASEDDSKSELIGNYDTFLQILTAQISNQDPTEPMDASEFTNQLVQYSAVEQQINTNEKMDLLLQSMNSNGITPLLSYVGQYTEVASSDEMVVQGGSGLMSYNLPISATSAEISIQDATGSVIGKITGTSNTGLNRIAWDGTMENGEQAPDGVYKYVLSAKNSAGDSLAIDDVRAIGQITGVETDANGDISLKIGDMFVDDEDVMSVFASIGVDES